MEFCRVQNEIKLCNTQLYRRTDENTVGHYLIKQENDKTDK